MPFDPYKPPMSVQESERLLRKDRDHEATKAYWAYNVSMLGAILWILLVMAFIGGVFWLLGEAIGTTASIVIGCLFFYFRDHLRD